MERQTLTAEKREGAGKGVARSLRRTGSTPAVIYRENKSTPLKLNSKELQKFIRDTKGDQVLVNIKLDGGNKVALLKDFQTDPVNGELLHADFFEVSLKEKVRVAVHITLTGEPIGIKRDKGILQYGTREIEVECLPDDIPGHLDLDISEMEIGDSRHVMEIDIPKGVTLLSDPDDLVITVVAPKVEEEVVPEEVAAEEEGAEPEVAEKPRRARPRKKRRPKRRRRRKLSCGPSWALATSPRSTRAPVTTLALWWSRSYSRATALSLRKKRYTGSQRALWRAKKSSSRSP
jgi:large subunit ribosomal protein L25